MPEGKFRLIKTKAKGTLMIVPGSDTTNRAIVFCGISAGFRGSCGLLKITEEFPDNTSAQVMKRCSAGNATDARNEFVFLVEAGQKIVLYSKGRRTNSVVCHSWDGDVLTTTEYQRSEWEALQQAQEDFDII
jgi:hypothetical protein